MAVVMSAYTEITDEDVLHFLSTRSQTARAFLLDTNWSLRDLLTLMLLPFS